MQRISVSLGEGAFSSLQRRAAAEKRSVSGLAALLLEEALDVGSAPVPPVRLKEIVPEALGEEDLGVEPSSAVPPPGLGSSSPSVEPVLGEGDPSGVSGDGLVSGPADAKAPSRATAASSPSPSTTAFVSGLLAREPKKGECPRVLQHRKGEFCKTCNEMIT